MICIHNEMRSHGFATDDAPHTRIPGIWKKLWTMFDLAALDEREINHAFRNDPDPTDPADANNMPEFELPEAEFGELMWQRRFHREESAAASSPGLMSAEDEQASYVPDMGRLEIRPGSARSQKAETPAEATPTPKTAKGPRASRATAKGGKGTKASAKSSKAQSAASESAEEEEDEEEEESSVESEEDSAPTTRRTNRGRTKAAPKQRKGKR